MLLFDIVKKQKKLFRYNEIFVSTVLRSLATKTLLPEGYGDTLNNLILYLAAPLKGIERMTVYNRVI
jgi:hypothetical protein